MASTAALSCPKIMQRPSEAIRRPAAAEKQIMRKKESKSSPAILTPSSAVDLEKEEKKNDEIGSVMIPEEGRPQAPLSGGSSGSAAADDDVDPWLTKIDDGPDADAPTVKASSSKTTKASSAAAAWNPLEEVDSALLSALCDGRERKALFRLEQVMIDFMRDKKSGSMDVGGAFNSIVLTNKGDGGEGLDGQQGLQDLQSQQQRGQRQTSFQRLILHRLADRFNILREQINIENAGRGLVDIMGVMNMNMGGQLGMIRLVKTEESCIPSHLLIDIDLAILINFKNPRARSNNYGGGNNYGAHTGVAGNVMNTNEDSTGMRNLSDNMASASLMDTPAAMAGVASSSGGKKLTKKMVIMKRNSSSGSNPDGKNKGKQKGKTRRKKLEDREKAYEEARARIFGGKSQSSTTINDTGSDGDNGEKGETSDSFPQENGANPLMSSTHSSFSLKSLENEQVSAPSASLVPSQLMSADAARAYRSSPSSPTGSLQGINNQDTTPTEEDSQKQMTSYSSANLVPPAAATGGAISKAVYRNRQQEENDPDFKRRSDVRPAYVPYVTANPYGHPQLGGGGGNPYAVMGQQGPPPQMMGVPPPHFYHGQQHQFATPQDANFAINTNAQAQWAAANPHHRGFYPTQPQSRGVNNPGGSISPPSMNPMNSSHSSKQQMQHPATKVLWGPGGRGTCLMQRQRV